MLVCNCYEYSIFCFYLFRNQWHYYTWICKRVWYPWLALWWWRSTDAFVLSSYFILLFFMPVTAAVAVLSIGIWVCFVLLAIRSLSRHEITTWNSANLQQGNKQQLQHNNSFADVIVWLKLCFLFESSTVIVIVLLFTIIILLLF